MNSVLAYELDQAFAINAARAKFSPLGTTAHSGSSGVIGRLRIRRPVA